nr:Ig-like domain-containing protein [uncultured Flavobacterium sp.]
MKKIKFLFFLAFFAALFTGCQDDNEDDFPASEKPTLVVGTTEIYGAPNRKFEIKATLADDLGLKSVRIQIPELSLDKVISFGTEPLVTSYDLSYFFEIPSDRGSSEAFKIKLTVTDVSNGTVEQDINLRLDGEFDAPSITMITPKEGAVVLLSTSNLMTVNFTVNDDSGIDFVEVKCDALEINEMVQLTGAPQSYTFNKTYTLPVTAANYVLTITAKDKFAIPNTGSLNINVVATNEYPAIYLCDQPKGTNLKTDAVGVPMYFHDKNGQDFEFKYYADADNKEVYFLGQESDFEPHCFGLDASGNLKDNAASAPIVLPTKGYYKIKVNPNTLAYTVTKYTPTSKVWADIANGLWDNDEALRRPFVSVCGGGIKDANWDTWNGWVQKGLHLANNPNNPYQLVGEYTLTGTMEATFTGQWWNPSWRLIKNGIATMSPGENGNGIYPAAPGVYKVIVDTELERAFITKK